MGQESGSCLVGQFWLKVPLLEGCSLELAWAAISESLKTGAGGSHGRQVGAGSLDSLHVGLSTGLRGPRDMQLAFSRVSGPRAQDKLQWRRLYKGEGIRRWGSLGPL